VGLSLNFIKKLGFKMRVDDAARNMCLSLPDVTEVKREDEEIRHSVTHHAHNRGLHSPTIRLNVNSI
jgi:hypothetical protein